MGGILQSDSVPLKNVINQTLLESALLMVNSNDDLKGKITISCQAAVSIMQVIMGR